MKTELVSVWRFNADRSKLCCIARYELSTDRFSKGIELTAQNYPRYFAAVNTERTIAAHDAVHDPRTSEFAEAYLPRYGITSMLDAALWVEGRLAGVVCHEHVGPMRRWSIEEQTFAGSIADFARLAIKAAEIQQAHDELETRVSQRTAELQRSNQELQQFAYVASHDLQEPLRAVSGYCQLLIRRYQGRFDQDADEFLQFAHEGAQRMQNLVNGLLEYSRVGVQQLHAAPVDCSEALNEARSNLQAAIDETEAEIQCELLPTVVGDRSQLVTLFQNLLNNSLKYQNGSQPHVAVRATEEPEFWRFAVCDNGIGIGDRHRTRIFEIFQRLHGRDEYPGTGIGLSICKRIVERHGGEIWVGSEQDGPRSTFYFTLPRTERT